MATRVINIRQFGSERTLPKDYIYVGRAFRRNGWNLPQSPWANPFPVEANDHDHSIACAKYDAYLRAKPLDYHGLLFLKGKTLVCWCKPKKCHADILAKLADSVCL